MLQKPVLNLVLKYIARLSEKQISWISAVVLLLGIPAIFVSIALVGTQQVEKSYTEGEVNRAVSLLENRIEGIDQILVDWSAWDDTYQFAQGKNPGFVKNNISVTSLNYMKIDFMLLTNTKNETLLEKNIERVSMSETRLPFTTADLLQKYPFLFDHPNLQSSHSGMVIMNNRVMLFASRPIITSQYHGPSQGTLIFGVWLDHDELASLSHLARREVQIYSLNDFDGLASELPESFLNLHTVRQHETVVRVLSGNISAGYRYLDDILGTPGMILQVNVPRDLYHQSMVTGLLFLVASILLGVVLYVLFQSLTITYFKAQNTSREYLARYQAVVQQSTEAILLVDGQWHIIEANRASQRLLEIHEDSTIPVSLMNVLRFEQQDSDNLLERASLTGQTFDRRCVLRDGTRLDIEISASKIAYLSATAYSLILRDITNRKETEKALRASEERYFLATRGANDGLWDWNLMTDEIYYSSRWKAMLGYTDDEVLQSPYEWFDRINPEDRIQVRAQLSEHLNRHSEHFECEHRILHKDGRYRWMLTRAVAVWNEEGFAMRIAGSQTDITERKEMEEQLRYDALHDGLTGLANRMLLLDRLKHVNERKRRIPEMLYGMFFLDFDRFKQINDTLGHQYGDLLLIEASRRLETCLRSSDTVSRYSGPETLARIAGDEFLILLEDLHTAQDAYRVADRIRTVLENPFYILGKEISIGVSIGIAVPEQSSEDPEEVIRNADIAMYNAKQKGGAHIARFTREMYEETAERMRLESELRHAVEQQEFRVFYQPIFALVDDRVIGFEALLRWGHPQRGLLSPSFFVDVADETGQIVPIGYQVLRDSCRKMREWHEKFHTTELIVSVNLSSRQLVEPGLVERIRLILEEENFDPKYLWLEVTENIVIHNLESVQTTLRVLRNMGISIKVDDFGTGYNTFSYLQSLPVDGLKIDRSFVQALEGSGQQIVDAMVRLGRDLGLTVVAEGVETIEQKEHLKQVSCDYMQGFLICGPLAENHAERFLVNALQKQDI